MHNGSGLVATNAEAVREPCGTWETRALGEVAEIWNGATPSTRVLAYWNGSIPWCVPTDVTGTAGKYLSTTARTITAEGLAASPTRLVPAGTILVCSRATVGESRIATSPLCTNQGLKSLVCNDSVSNEFVYYLLLTFKPKLVERATGSTFLEISRREIASIEAKFPPLTEQRAIAAALSEIDHLLQALETAIDKKRSVKRAAMQQLLTGKTRLPGFDGKWSTASLNDVANVLSGATPDTTNAAYWDGTIPWCTPTDITSTEDKYLAATNRTITSAGLASCPASLLPVGALLLCTRATIGEVKIATFPVCTNQGFKSLIAKDFVSNEFLYYLLAALKPRLIRLATGSTFGEIGAHDIGSIEVPLPPREEQCAIAGVLADMDSEVAVLRQRLHKTRAIKQGMLQQLLTGRVRLVEPDTAPTP